MDNSPAALFENYDDDLQQLVAGLKGKLEGDVQTLRGEPRKAALKKVSDDLDEAEEIISQMELEIPSMPVSIRKAFQERLAASKASVDKVTKQVRDLRASTQREELLSGAGGWSDDPYTDDDPSAFSARTRLLAGTEMLSTSSQRLDNAQRVALETEDVGADILRNLRGQREQIEHTRDTLTGADASIDRAAGTLKKMIHKMYQQKVVTGAIIAVLVLLIILVLWSKIRG
ncbi:hypothetical protein CspeluHIS016_0201630 [Cutaneotrichosporon spelunceum]|uniref:t-SNARE coiled-coil homology domain-containing protein n=1 Tax=Cutaneotrichosporon spelunceum TaxID=1672016 RepID=A0AAD3TRE7_9TREE|nr:hypothetical protein CspeluHIS016_0201630 [Cutaneotrichosporon spelunceum]